MARCGCGPQCSCVIVAGQNITVAGSGSSTNPYVISGEAGLPVLADTPSVDLSGDGTAGSPITAAVRYSTAAGNAAEAGPDGAVFVPDVATQLTDPAQCAAVQACVGSGGGGTVNVADTACIDLSGDGTAGNPITAAPIIDPDADNQIECGPAGLRSRPVAYITGNEVLVMVPSTPVTSGTWTSVDLTAIQARQVFAPPGATSLTIPETGLYDLSAFAAWQTTPGGDRRIRITVNGTRIAEEAATAGDSTTSLSVQRHRVLNAGDVVTFDLKQGSGGDLGAGCSYSIVRVA